MGRRLSALHGLDSGVPTPAQGISNPIPSSPSSAHKQNYVRITSLLHDSSPIILETLARERVAIVQKISGYFVYLIIFDQGMKMLNMRTSLEEKQKQNSMFRCDAPKISTKKQPQSINRQLENLDDFAEISINTFRNKRKADDSESGKANEEVGSDSDLEFYKEVERRRSAKLAAKSDKYSRISQIPSLPEAVHGKRDITNQMQKNRGLTRGRKKLVKNPRKKYKLKHKRAEMRILGQRPAKREAGGSYGGEASGINAGVSRSVRFKT